MAYKNNIPQPTDRLKDSQGDILNNFAGIKTAWDINHVTFDDADEGKHKFITFPAQGAAPTFGATENGLYNRASTISASNEIYVQKSSSFYPMTAKGGELTGANPAQGWAFLSSGMIMKWGETALVANTKTTVTFTTGATYPAFNTAPVSIMAQPTSSSPNSSMVVVVYWSGGDIPTALDFRMWCNQAVTVRWTAIGIAGPTVL